MSKLIQQMRARLQPGMHMPRELEELFGWIEAKGMYVDNPDVGRMGFLFPEQELRDGWTETERPGGTVVQFFSEDSSELRYWFGHERADVLNRLLVFARTGSDGSMAALWLDPSGVQKIVHLGSGSGSTLVCVLADQPIDFLRLLAIGYDEICWPNVFADPPNTGDVELFVHPNEPYRAWLKSTFGVDIPATASEIVKHPDDMDADTHVDPFAKWVAANVA